MRCRGAWVVCVLAMLSIPGCGDDGGAGGDCPKIAGTYTITAHCVAAQIGTTVTVSQSGCELTRFDPWTGWSGTISSAGVMAWSGDAGGTPMTCTGSVSGDTITGSCTPACDVTLKKQ